MLTNPFWHVKLYSSCYTKCVTQTVRMNNKILNMGVFGMFVGGHLNHSLYFPLTFRVSIRKSHLFGLVATPHVFGDVLDALDGLFDLR